MVKNSMELIQKKSGKRVVKNKNGGKNLEKNK